MNRKIQLSLIVPCFNEEKRLTKRFPKIYQFLKEKIKNFEIIFVDDGSKDKTKQIILELSEKYKNVLSISYSLNKGKGFAVKQGVERAKGELIGFTDADFAVSLEKLPEVLKLLENQYDIVIANRKTSDASLKNNPDILRRFFSFSHSKINNFFLELGPIKDTLCGFKFFRGDVARDLFKELSIYRWFFDLDVLIRARQKKLKIYQIPVDWEEIRGGQVKIIDAIKTSIKEHIIIYKNFFNTKIYSVLLSVLLFIFALPFLFNPQNLTTRSGDFSDLVWPDYYLFRESVLRYGEIPLWNPTLFSGIPEIANPQSPIIYPPNYLSLLINIDHTILILILLHAFIAGIFLFKIGRDLFSWSVLSSVVISLVFTFSPYLWGKASVGHISHFFAVSLIPVVIYFSLKYFKNGRLSNLFVSTIFLAGVYLNYPTIWYYVGFFGAITLILLKGFRDFKRSLVLFCLPVFSILLVLPVFLIQLQAGQLITRSELTPSDLAIPIWSIKRFIASIFIPSNLLSDLESEVWLYPSFIAILIAILGFLKVNLRIKLSVTVLISLVILITLGDRTPFFGFLTRFVPGFSYLRVSTRDWFMVVMTLAFLTGYFFQRYHFKFQKIFTFILFIDLFFFSLISFWFIPKEMQPRSLDVSLFSDSDFRTYCTSRCLSGKDTISNNINTADGYHLLILKNYRNAISKAGNFSPPKYTGNIPIYEDKNMIPNSEGLGTFAVGTVISENYLLDTNLTLFKSQCGFNFYVNNKALPRIRFENSRANSIKVLKDSPNSLILETSGGDDKLVVADSFYPGWEVFIDKEKKEIELYGGWARAVKVPVGNHKIEFYFNPFRYIFTVKEK